MTFNISVFKGYISIWTDDEDAMRRLNPRLLNGQPASCVAYDNGKVRCAFKVGVISLAGKDFFVRVTDDGNSWVMMPAIQKVAVATEPTATAKVATKAPVKAQPIAIVNANTAKKVSVTKTADKGQVTLI